MSLKRDNTVIIAGSFVDSTVTMAHFVSAHKFEPEIVVINKQEEQKALFEPEPFKISKCDLQPISSLEIKDGKALRRERRKKNKKKK